MSPATTLPTSTIVCLTRCDLCHRHNIHHYPSRVSYIYSLPHRCLFPDCQFFPFATILITTTLKSTIKAPSYFMHPTPYAVTTRARCTEYSRYFLRWRCGECGGLEDYNTERREREQVPCGRCGRARERGGRDKLVWSGKWEEEVDLEGVGRAWRGRDWEVAVEKEEEGERKSRG